MTQPTKSTTGYYRSPSPEVGVAERYTSPEYLALEYERLWPYVWQIACHVDEIPNGGDYLEYEIGRESILIVRLADGRLKAFHNACQHRGMRLKTGRGNATELRCRSHAWCWNLDGSLKEVIDPQDFDPAAIDPDRIGLPEVQIDTWSGLVFVNMDAAAPPLQDFLGVVPDRVAHFRMGDMRLLSKVTTKIACNWKLAHEAFVETYHAIGTHPQALRYVDDTSLEYEQHGIHGMHRFGPQAMGSPSKRLDADDLDRGDILLAAVAELASANLYRDEEVEAMRALVPVVNALPEDASMTGFFANLRREEAKANGVDLSAYSDRDIALGPLWNLFPNITIPCNAGNILVFRWRPDGLNPESCYWDKYELKFVGQGQEVPEPNFVQVDDWRDYRHWGVVLEQDLTNLPIWQLGVRTRGFSGPIWGRPDGNVANMHRVLGEYLAKER
ncbi:aromatic ring-hydroxylating dioxygenase subunit alpha [Actinomadura madurae]|uniref:aromatic ring-hydroxylating oxygenase subunit alpha n=1 Tax=Actinomadura madurae TaxID=1993 RepID=UPI00399B9DFF